MFPDSTRLRRLLDYLSIRPATNLVALEETQIFDPSAGNKITQDALNKIEHIRKAVYNYRNYNQIGYFEFQIGLIMLEQDWFSEAAESFEKAGRLWSFMPERPNICLANFAKGVAHHRNRRFDLAETIYADVQEQINRIQEEVKGPTSIPQIKNYQEFVTDLTAQLEEARKTVERDIFHDLSPRIHPSLQSDTQNLSSPHLPDIDQEILRANIQRHFGMAELKAICFGLKIDFNALEGTGMAGKARSLVVYCIRNRRLQGFLEELSRRKPSVAWDKNVLQPSPGDVIEEEPPEPKKSEEVEEGEFEPFTMPDDGLEFIREFGKVHFRPEVERTRPYTGEMVIVNIELSGQYDTFSLGRQTEFIDFISRVTDIDPNQITILEARDGSILVTVEMPEESAKLLIAMLLEKDPMLRNFRILKVELGDAVGPQTEEHDLEPPPNLADQVDPDKLKKFIPLYFSETELKDLHHALKIDFGSLPGRGKREVASQLVNFCRRQKKYPNLVNMCYRRRTAAFKITFLNIP